MDTIILLLGLFFNCFITSETKAKVVLSEEGKGDYYTSSILYISEDKTLSLPIVDNYEYLIIYKNSDKSKPSVYIDGDWCNKDYIKLSPKKSYFITIEVGNSNCTTLIIAVK
jgi:hypothetical protein